MSVELEMWICKKGRYYKNQQAVVFIFFAGWTRWHLCETSEWQANLWDHGVHPIPHCRGFCSLSVPGLYHCHPLQRSETPVWAKARVSAQKGKSSWSAEGKLLTAGEKRECGWCYLLWHLIEFYKSLTLEIKWSFIIDCQTALPLPETLYALGYSGLIWMHLLLSKWRSYLELNRTSVCLWLANCY